MKNDQLSNSHLSQNDLPRNLTEQDFFDRPSTIQWILRIFYTICILLVITDFIIHRHIETAAEKIPAFYALYGFVACVVLVLLANQVRKFLMRDENYYEDESEGNSGCYDSDETSSNKSNRK